MPCNAYHNAQGACRGTPNSADLGFLGGRATVWGPALASETLRRMNVSENPPRELRAASEAALEWINATQGSHYEITGVIDAEDTVAQAREGSFELGLVLCDGDVCAREQVVVERSADGFRVSAADADDPLIPPLLDPPIGVRTGWLNAQLDKHKFVVLVFYRGLW